MQKLTSLSRVFPVLNDANIIGKLIKKAEKAALQCSYDFEIIVVDDGSIDNTW